MSVKLGLTPPLTNSEALDLTDLAAIVSELAGRTITRVTVSDDDYIATLVSYGMSKNQAQFLLGIFAASRNGEFASVNPTLAEALDRPPVLMRDVIRQWVLGAG